MEITDKIKLLDDLEEIANAIAEEAGPNIDYCASMDMSLFPVVVYMTMEPDERECNCPYNDSVENIEKALKEDCTFLSENGCFFPNTMVEASLEKYFNYASEHQDEILSRIREAAEAYYEEYTDRPFNEK